MKQAIKKRKELLNGELGLSKKSFSIKKFNSQQFIGIYLYEVKRCLEALDTVKLEVAIDMIMQAYKNNKNVFILGNGGSASTASHMACDLGKGTLSRIYDNSERRLRVLSLTDNVALMTALANDLSYEDIFIQQLRNLVQTDDLVIALSGSGNSSNIIKAIKYARECGAKTIGLLGFKTGGKLAKLVDCSIIVDSMEYGPIEDIQLILNHIIASWVARIKIIHDGKENSFSENKAIPFRH